MSYRNLLVFAALATGFATSSGAQSILTTSNGIIRNSLCVGADCQSGISFVDSTLILKENNTRLKFTDTSASASFPNRDWELEANSQTNGGQNHFAIVDCGAASNDGGCTTPNNVFTVEAGAGTNAVYVDDGGRVGFGTATPSVELHVVDGDSPTLRLAQDGSSGFTPQTWDIAGNEANFFIRDVTNGSSLPFRIRQDAPTSSIDIAADEVIVNGNGTANDFRVESDTELNAFFVDGGTGFVGAGTNTPEQLLHVASNAPATDAFALFDAAGSGSDAAFLLRQNGTTPTTWEFRNQESSGRLSIGIAGGNTPLKIDDLANNNLLKLGTNGNPDVVEVTGRLLVNSTQLNVPDYVFADDYTLRPLADVRSFIDTNSHLPEVPSASDIARDGVDMTEMQMVLLKKVEELTLYTLEQDRLITAQQKANVAHQKTNAEQQKSNAALHDRLDRIEAMLEQ